MKQNVRNKWISLLSAVAFSVSAAAAASSVIVRADVVHLRCMTTDEVPWEETAETTREETSEPQTYTTIVSAVTCDAYGYSEKVVSSAKITDFRQEEETCDAACRTRFVGMTTAENESTEAADEALWDIQMAEQRTALAPAGYIDVGNCTSLMYDIGNQQSMAVTLVRLTGNSSNAKALWDFCKSLGYTDAGAAAVLGNLAMESGLNPAAKSSNFDYEDGLGGGGLAGWMCRGRFRGLMALAEENGLPWTDLSLQMSYLQYELEHTRKHVGDEMKVQNCVDEAADYFCVYFEGCIGRSQTPAIDDISTINGEWYQGLAKRKALARAYYEKYADN